MFRLSRDPRVHIVSKVSVTRIARILMTPVIVTLLLAPVIVCNRLNTITVRLIVVVTAASIFVAILLGSTNAKIMELVIAGCDVSVKSLPRRAVFMILLYRYTTVLVFFITSNNISTQQQV